MQISFGRELVNGKMPADQPEVLARSVAPLAWKRGLRWRREKRTRPSGVRSRVEEPHYLHRLLMAHNVIAVHLWSRLPRSIFQVMADDIYR
jgi:hypothetical protein